ncbi:MAG: glycosyl transferase [Gammaproteobacteria bacterium]|nr:MAG: glycosyl transferase [Gammaproteobacteria bacterium]
MKRTVDVIVPVYGGVEETRRCLESVAASKPKTDYRLVIVNDASPDPEMLPMLEEFLQQHPEAELHQNPTNLGFVGTVNLAMQLHPDHDVVLLNSDTEVSGDWLDRLVAAAGSEEKVATVTPFSNNATICSFPRFCEDNPLPRGWSLEELDALFARVNQGATVEIPTGVGFCMFISREAIDALGTFDQERFGRGYGEENDFCLRAADAGWKNLLCCDVFVEHKGGVSFSSEQAERIARAQETLDRLHPNYHALIHQHIHQDPARPYRFRALIEMVRTSPRQKVLHLTHHLGGGTLKHIRELEEHLQDEMDSLLLRPNHEGHTSLYFGTETGAPSIAFDLPHDYPELLELLRSLGLSRIHFHHTLALETRLWGLPEDLGIPFDITIHDYYFINAHPTQTDARGRYQPDLAKQQSSYPLSTSLEEWQENQRGLLDAAERVIAPSKAAAREMARHYPELEITVAWHPDSEQNIPWPGVRPRPLESEPLRILVLGALSPEKGADLLEEAAECAAAEGAQLEFHLLGYAYRPLSERVVSHGAYSHDELAERIRAIAPHLIWFTALWPETYSYTLSEALLTGLPLVVPEIGAFPERIQNRPLTWVEPWQRPGTEWVDFFTGIRTRLQEAPDELQPWHDQPAPAGKEQFYRNGYLPEAPTAVVPEPLDHTRLEAMLAHSRSLEDGNRRSRREALLKRLILIRQGRIGRIVARMVPVNLQRKIKRKLSRKPIHELDD